ncbi:hypothetical protein HDU98_011852 [Podochytrium sp. JEL0797]|nr:hypothetical protein HDU98_011852 [Podochytrium sp. JEL0797]
MNLEEKYKCAKRKLREVLEENEFLASKLWQFKTRLMAVEKERELSVAGCEWEPQTLIRFGSPSLLLSRLKKTGMTTESLDLMSDSDESITGVPTLPSINLVPLDPSTPLKPKKKQRKPIASKPIRIQKYETKEDGSAVFPLSVGVMTILAIGNIVSDRVAYHSDRYIYPVGYKSVRNFLSIVDPDKSVNYECEIVDGGDAPRFVVTPEDFPERRVEAGSLTGAWSPFFKAAHALRNKEHASGLSGPEFFGLTQGIVQKLIQELPGSEECKNYVVREFEFIQARGTKRAIKAEGSGAATPATASKRPRHSQILDSSSASFTSFESSSPITLPPPQPEHRASRYDDDDLDGDDDLDASDGNNMSFESEVGNVTHPNLASSAYQQQQQQMSMGRGYSQEGGSLQGGVVPSSGGQVGSWLGNGYQAYSGQPNQQQQVYSFHDGINSAANRGPVGENQGHLSNGQ